MDIDNEKVKCFVMKYSEFCNHLAEEQRADCFTLVEFLSRAGQRS